MSSRIAVCGQQPVSHRADPLGRQHAVAPQEVGVLGGVDVVGHHGQRAARRPSARHSAATSAVLPRADRPADADAQRARPAGQRRVRVDAGVVVRVRRSSRVVVVRSGRKETHLPGGVELGERCRAAGAARGRQVAPAGRRRGAAASAATASHVGGQAGEQRVHRVRVEAEQPHRRAGRAGDARRTRPTSAASAGVAARPRPRPRRARAAGAGRRRPRQVVSAATGHSAPRRPAAAPGPAPATPARSAGDGGPGVEPRRRARPTSPASPAGRSAARPRRSAAATRPAVCSRPRRNAARSATSLTRPAATAASSAAGVRVAAGREAGRRRAASSVRRVQVGHQNRK